MVTDDEGSDIPVPVCVVMLTLWQGTCDTARWLILGQTGGETGSEPTPAGSPLLLLSGP